MARTTVLLIRHGHTWNNGGGGSPRMSGWSDFPLSERGHAQVRRLCARLQTSPGFAAIYSSPLTRALQTAEPLCTAGLGALEVCPGLKEINCGEVDGLPIEEVRARYPELWAATERQDDDHLRWPGGESYEELRQRALSTLRELGRRHAGCRIIAVTHAGVISQVVGSLHALPPARWSDFRPENTAITELSTQGNGFQLIRFDDHLHLDPQPRLAL